MKEIEVLLGKTISNIEIAADKSEILFTTSEGEQYKMFHYQDCCEGVTVEDVIGDISDLIGVPILMADEIISEENPEGIVKEYQESFTWTFYKLATIKGYVTIRWYGESNGYYSEGVSFEKVNE